MHFKGFMPYSLKSVWHFFWPKELYNGVNIRIIFNLVLQSGLLHLYLNQQEI